MIRSSSGRRRARRFRRWSLGRIILDAGWPEDALSVFPCSLEDTARLVEDERIKLLTFTGSAAVGWSLKSRAGRKRVTLELGGNAAVIVHADADVAYAAERVALAGYSYAGQSCISAQRIYVHDGRLRRIRGTARAGASRRSRPATRCARTPTSVP